jgi:hypothetical protein
MTPSDLLSADSASAAARQPQNERTGISKDEIGSRLSKEKAFWKGWSADVSVAGDGAAGVAEAGGRPSRSAARGTTLATSHVTLSEGADTGSPIGGEGGSEHNDFRRRGHGLGGAEAR